LKFHCYTSVINGERGEVKADSPDNKTGKNIQIMNGVHFCYLITNLPLIRQLLLFTPFIATKVIISR